VSIRLSYNPQALRGTVLLKHAYCQKSTSLELDMLVSQLHLLLEDLKAKGEIVAYEVNRQRLDKAVEIVGAMSFPWKDREFKVEVAQAYPAIYGCVIQPPKHREAVASLSLRDHDRFAKFWSHKLLHGLVQRYLRDRLPDVQVSEGQIATALALAGKGEVVQNMQIFAAKLAITSAESPYDIFSFPLDSSLYLAINDVWPLLGRRSPAEIVNDLRSQVQTIGERRGSRYMFVEDRIHQQLSELTSSQYALGFELPINMLVAVALPVAQLEGAVGSAATTAAVEVKKASETRRKEHLHSGDIIRTMGVMHFEEDTIVKGSIESGAIVSCAGNMQVLGQIKGAFVRVQGSLLVEGGISMGDSGYIYVSGNLKSQFVESAHIACKGSMEVVKTVLNSIVNVGENLILTGHDSMAAGGVINCRAAMRVRNLGLRLGRKTILRLGIDWVAENRIENIQRRLRKVEELIEAKRNDLRELVTIQKNSRSPELDKRKVDLQKLLQKGRPIIEKLQETLAQIRSRYKYHAQTQVTVLGTVDVNCEIFVCGKMVNLEISKQKVVIKAQPKGVPLIEAA
jgi:septum formation inhibitor MinC